jgi:hypothetical protein
VLNPIRWPSVDLHQPEVGTDHTVFHYGSRIQNLPEETGIPGDREGKDDRD